MSDSIKIDVWSDVACPWCYIGKRKLERAIEVVRRERPDVDLTVEYRSYILAPDLPEDFEGSEVDYLVSRKGIEKSQAQAMIDRVAAAAAEIGLRYDFDALRPANTKRAHQLVHYAKARGKQALAKERLMSAHFVEGRHVGRLDELVDLAAEIGLDRDDVRRALESGEHADDVRADVGEARELGITGVPFFLVAGRFGLYGAQSVEALAGAIRRAVDEAATVAS